MHVWIGELIFDNAAKLVGLDQPKQELIDHLTEENVGKIDNCKFKFRTRFIMTRIKPSMHDSNILDSTYIINMIMKQI